jgi:hypothetical protein
MRTPRVRRAPSASRREITVLFSALAVAFSVEATARAEAPESSENAPEPAAEPAQSAAPKALAVETSSAPAAGAATATSSGATPVPRELAPQRAPYSLPFQLRPAVASSVVRLDTTVGFYKDPATDKSGTTVAPILLASYRVTEHLAPLVRLGVVSNSPPTGSSGFGFLNPVLGAIYALEPAPPLRLGLFLGVTLPVGSGGGDSPDKAEKAARTAGIPARSAMDNAMFAVNDFTVFPGVDLAYVAGGFTAQVEATVFQLTRVRGSKDQPDSSRTNFTAGLHVGYFVIPALSIGAELRHQRWLSTPKQVENDATHTLRDTTTVAFGPRVHLDLGGGKWLRPAIVFALPLDDPMKKASEKVLQIDVPFAF